MRWLWLTCCAGLLLVLAVARAGSGPRLIDPLPFDHGTHAKAFDKARVGCVTCHPVGLRVGEGESLAPPVTPLAPALSSCHACHLREVKGAPRNAPMTCTTCHADRQELVPADHAQAWLQRHGVEARTRGASCETCHATSACMDCHDRRGPVTVNPHAAGFARTHGIEARLDPASCTSCHAADACTTCHVQGVRPW